MNRLACLIALMTIPLTLLAAPKYPFPQKAVYKFGIMPKNIDHDKVQQAYEDFMKLYKEEGDLARIQHDSKENSVSEGIAYGMFILVYMDNAKNNTQSMFDKIWRYYNKFLDDNGLMNWKISGFSSVANRGAATDAELDAAFALLMAYKQWGDEKYLNDAKSLIEKIAKHEVNDKGYLKPGDSWDSEKNPSYFSTAALELYKNASTFDWAKVIANSYSLLKKVQDGTTGLVPNWCSEEGKPSGGDRGYYTYDATRTPWRIAWAYSWYGHQDAKDICTKMASWIAGATSSNPEKIVDGYQLNGSKVGQWSNATFVGPFVCAGMVDEKHQDWLDKSYAFLAAMKEDVYYQVSLKILTMLYLSGNMPNLWDYNPIAVVQPVTVSVAARSVIKTAALTSGVAPSLTFTLSGPEQITISLYSVSGKRVAHVAPTVYSAGSTTIVLDRVLAAGSYLVTMKSGSGMVTQRLMVTE